MRESISSQAPLKAEPGKAFYLSRLAIMVQAVKSIDALVNNPHWTAQRKERIGELAISLLRQLETKGHDVMLPPQYEDDAI